MRLIPVETPHQLRTFIRLPFELNRGRSGWVPPFIGDERSFHDPRKNPMLRECETMLYLLEEDGRTIGRVMGIIHTEYNQKHNEQTARFFKLECIDNAAAFHCLINAIEEWARSKGMNRLIGPFGFSDKDPQGFQIEGFGPLPVISAPSNSEHLPRLLAACGYEKHLDCVSYHLHVPKVLPLRMNSLASRARTSSSLKMISFTKRSQLKPWIVPVFRLVNTTYAGIFGFMPLTEEEMHVLARQYLPVLDPEFTKLIIDSSNQPVAFVIAMPDISKGVQRARGRVLPFGFFHILSEQRKSKLLVTLLGAVKEGWTGRGLTAWLGEELLSSATARGMKDIDSHLILEQNTAMRGVMDKFGGRIYKRFRIYQKDLHTKSGRI
ncbi:MAG: hypothetical protein LW707_03885 [Sphingobacteriales bacterium]|nr:hypothetical protein [Sphingobacteriales bacterium]